MNVIEKVYKAARQEHIEVFERKPPRELVAASRYPTAGSSPGHCGSTPHNTRLGFTIEHLASAGGLMIHQHRPVPSPAAIRISLPDWG
jgi:hypothetical protein